MHQGRCLPSRRAREAGWAALEAEGCRLEGRAHGVHGGCEGRHRRCRARVPPNEIVAWDPKLMTEGVDPMIRRAEELLKKGFPNGAVAYAPSKSKPR